MLVDMLRKVARGGLGLLPVPLMLAFRFVYKFGRWPDFNHPRTFNEKINWRKLYQRDPRMVVYADKIAVKDVLSQTIGLEPIIPTLWVGERAEDIPFDQLVPPYVLKTSHGCADVVFVREGETLDVGAVRAKMRRALRAAHGRSHGEWAYLQIPRRVLAERMIKGADGGVPEDYKFFVYHGRVHFVQMDRGRFAQHEMAFFDRQWNKLPFTKGHPQISEEAPYPLHFEEMISLAEKIGAAFDFVRVDLYDTPEGVFFGEATFYPAGGFGRFYPDVWDEVFGKPWMFPEA